MTETKHSTNLDDILDALTGPASDDGQARGQSPDERGQSPDQRGQSPDQRGQSPDERGHLPDPRGQLLDQIERAESEFDAEAAQSSARELVKRLEQDPSDVRALDALIVLGLAHPDALERERVPLEQEAKRLALVLERNGEIDRAQQLLETLSARSPANKQLTRDLASMMRRTGNAARLIERYLERARAAVAIGHRDDAIAWLQEALLIDHSRRDIARMIRDLRFDEVEKVSLWKKRVARLATVFAVTAAVGMFMWREHHVAGEFAQIEPANERELASLQRRLDSLDDFVARHWLWLGVMQASSERAELRIAIQKMESAAAASALERKQARERSILLAEAARNRGRDRAEKGDMPAALASFRDALEAAPGDWQERERVQADVDAIVLWQRGATERSK